MLANMLKTYSSTETLRHSKWRVCSQASSSRTREYPTSNPDHKWSLYFRLEALGWNLCGIARERDPVQEPIMTPAYHYIKSQAEEYLTGSCKQKRPRAS